MKPILLFLLPALAVSCAPTKEIQTAYPAPFEYKIIDSVKGTQDALFVRAQEWVAKTYNNSNNILRLVDKEAGKMVGKALITYRGTNLPGGTGQCNSSIKYTLTIDVKDNKYRFELSDFYHEGCVTGGPSGGSLSEIKPDGTSIQIGTWLSVKKKAQANAQALVKSFQNHMATAGKNKNDGF